MALQFPCSKCGKTLKVSDRFAGKKIRCPNCSAVTAAPAEGTSKSGDSKLARRKKSRSSKKASASRIGGASRIGSASKLGRSKGAELDTYEDVAPVDFKKKDKEEDELDMTPMVDVTFLLLIFFMVTAAFTLQKSMEFPKPSSDNTVIPDREMDEEKGNILIRVDKDSAIWVDEAPEPAPSKQDLRVQIREAKAGTPGSNSPPIKIALVKAHEESLHEVVVMVLDACCAENMDVKLRTVTEDDL
jgi:biopolymer transport protein ExbD